MTVASTSCGFATVRPTPCARGRPEAAQPVAAGRSGIARNRSCCPPPGPGRGRPPAAARARSASQVGVGVDRATRRPEGMAPGRPGERGDPPGRAASGRQASGVAGGRGRRGRAPAGPRGRDRRSLRTGRRGAVTPPQTLTRTPPWKDRTDAAASATARWPARAWIGGSSPDRNAARMSSTWWSNVCVNVRALSLKYPGCQT
jgi:hypothetical protein